ncbi:hypothetical protein L596_000105 [Steinernema carpocapsae]|uniref:Uncharacterized protein n=1 Tax=Steinernema carpocapsae TaxID=34508 RepID=A0A4U8ULC2_STECR|nr:hypothetical protein L596_000105 [Steinernema carpocapsae]
MSPILESIKTEKNCWHAVKKAKREPIGQPVIYGLTGHTVCLLDSDTADKTTTSNKPKNRWPRGLLLMQTKSPHRSL